MVTATLLRLDAPTAAGEPRPRPKSDATTTARRGSDQHEGADLAMDLLLPPRRWHDESGKEWRQHTSLQPASRMDVIDLQDALDAKLHERQARESGLCLVRSELYRECFDELIRQVTLESVERGALLLRVRDHLRLTTSAYEGLTASSVAFGVHKQVESEAIPPAVAAARSDAERKSQLEAQVRALHAQLEAAERKAVEDRAAAERQRAEELGYLRQTIKQLDAYIKSRGG